MGSLALLRGISDAVACLAVSAGERKRPDRAIGDVIGLEQDAARSGAVAQHAGDSTLIRRKGRAPMKLSAALDTSTTKTAICVVNSRDGSVVFEATVATDRAIIFEALAPYRPRLDRIGHEAGAVAPWLHRELTAFGLPMVLLETRHAAAALDVQRNKTDKNGARGLAHLMRSGWYRPVHVKSVESHKLRLLLGHRRTLKRKLRDIENEIRHALKVFGLQAGRRVQRASFETRIRDLVAHDPLISGVIECMLRAWAALWTEYKRLHQLVVQLVGRDELCRRYCRIPGVGPVTALLRFVKSKTVDEAASAMLVRSQQWCGVKALGLKIAKKRGHKRAVVAVARKLPGRHAPDVARWQRVPLRGERGAGGCDDASGARRRVMERSGARRQSSCWVMS
jgi:transposase